MADAKIMIVDDNLLVAEDLKVTLVQIGYTVVAIAKDGEKALKKADECLPDLVLMDINLGTGIDGIETASKIREKYDSIIVYLTAYTDEKTLKRAKMTEPHGFIVKPFDEKELKSTIEIALYKKQSELFLAESHRWVETILKSIGDAVIASDANGKVTFINPVAQRLTGWEEIQAVGMPVREVFHIVSEETDKVEEDPVSRVLKDGTIVGLANHTLLINKAGLKIPIADSGAPIKDDKGDIIGVVLIFRDQTKERKAQKVIEDSEKKLRDAQIITKVGNWSWNIDTGEVTWSDALFDILQMPKQKPSFDLAKKMVHSDDMDLWINTIEKAAKEKKPFELEYRAVGENGNIIWIKNKTTFLEESGNSIFFGTAQDITEQKITENALIETAEILKEAQRFAQIGSWRYDPATQMPTWTEEMFHIFGLEPQPEALPYEEHRKIIHPEDWNHFDESVNKAVSSGIGYNIELRITRPSGELRYVNARCEAEKNELGEVIRLIGTTQDITDRKLAEIDLRKSEDRFLLAMESAQDGLYDWNIITNEIYYSPGWKRILGYQDNELPNEASIWETLTKPDDVKRSWEMRQDLIHKKRDRYELEFKMKHKDGHWVDILARATAIFDKDDTAIRIVGTHVDISERKASERELKKQRDLFELVINSVPARIFWKDLNLVYIGCNNNFAKDSGMEKPEDVIGKDDYDLVWKKDADIYRSDDKLVINTGKPKLNYEEAFLNSDGKRVWWMTSKIPLRGSDGKIVGIIATSENITEQKKAEKALQTSHERFTTVLDGIDATVYVADMQTYEILFMNKFMKDAFGKDMTGEICWNVFRGESGPCRHCKNSSIIDENGMPTGVSVWQDENPITGKCYIYHDRAIEWIDGRLVKLQIATDITDYKRLEKKLRQAQKMESIGKLAGGIAHDFNNILYPIMGFTQMSMDELPKNHPVQENLLDVLDGAKRARDLVKQILLFSRQQDQVFKPTSLKPVIEETLKLLRSSLPATINIQSNFHETDDCVLCDGTQIHEIVMNLCTNSYHALKDRGGEIKVELSHIQPDDSLNLPPGQYICLSVVDNGSGIPENDLNKIFEPYFTTKDVGKGSGLGLSVVHGIVKNYKGEIRVTSKPGKGSCFDIILPLTNPEIQLKEKQEVKNSYQGTESILFVDDETSIVKLGVRFLKRQGYKLTGMQDSMDALALVASDPDTIDLVITDMAMPKIDGLELSKKLHEISPNIPVIICSGYSRKMDKTTIQIPNIKAIIDKPILIESLTKTVREVLDSNLENRP